MINYEEDITIKVDKQASYYTGKLKQNDKLKITVLEVPQKSYLQVNQQFIITEKGWDDPSNLNRQDGLVLFGRKSELKPSKNDFYFHESNCHVSRKQFTINCQQKGKIQLFDSQSNSTLIKVQNIPIKLKTGSIFQLAHDNYFMIKQINDSSNEDFTKRQQQNNLELSQPTIINIDQDQKQQNDDDEDVTIKVQKDYDNQDLIYIEIECLKGQYEGKVFKFSLKQMNNHDNKFQYLTIGRLKTCDLILNQSDISKIHCEIIYDQTQESWFISEKIIPQQNDYSSNGTYLFLKTFDQFNNQQDSDLVHIDHDQQIYIENTLIQLQLI